MSGESHAEVHRHPAPTGFIRKYIFSIDHKVIGIQYILLALAAVVVGMTMSVLMRMNLSDKNQLADPGHVVSWWSARRHDDAGVLSLACDNARHDHGLFRVDDGAPGRIWQLLPADSNRRR